MDELYFKTDQMLGCQTFLIIQRLYCINFRPQGKKVKPLKLSCILKYL